MAANEKEYVRLPGRGRRREGWISMSRTTSRLWLGKDHLLCIDSEGFRETYKRFYYRDIQALVLEKTRHGMGWNFFLSGMTLVLVLIGLGTGDAAFRAFWFILAGVFALLFLVNWLRGPTAACSLRTAVQTEELPSLNRLRQARKAMARLGPLIEQAQGSLARESIAEQLREWSARESVAPTVAPPPHVAARKAAQALRPYNSRAHAVLFSVLLLNVLLQGVKLFHTNIVVALCEVLAVTVFCAVLIWALIRQQDSDLPRRLQQVTWAGLVFLAVLAFFGFMHQIILAMDYPEIADNQWELLKLYAEISPLESGWMMAVLLFEAFTSLVLGALGWGLLLRFYSGRDASPPVSKPQSATLINPQ